jgi:hypothetical protein
MAGGCTSGHGLSGMPLLSVQVRVSTLSSLSISLSLSLCPYLSLTRSFACSLARFPYLSIYLSLTHTVSHTSFFVPSVSPFSFFFDPLRNLSLSLALLSLSSLSSSPLPALCCGRLFLRQLSLSLTHSHLLTHTHALTHSPLSLLIFLSPLSPSLSPLSLLRPPVSSPAAVTIPSRPPPPHPPPW